ncbi:hypothetical protein AB0L40_25750, partial [Patulibacter sp. NPDC049589]
MPDLTGSDADAPLADLGGTGSAELWAPAPEPLPIDTGDSGADGSLSDLTRRPRRPRRGRGGRRGAGDGGTATGPDGG